MKITKLGHCCLIIEENGVRIMTDPGVFSTVQNAVTNIDYVFITHEHTDHCHVESLKTVMVNNPKAKIITNRGVGSILQRESIPFEVLEHGQKGTFDNVMVSGHGEKHAEIYKEFGQVQNTGYFFDNRFFYPGDSFFNPGKPVEILALPVAGPWLKIADAIDYAKLIKPNVAFPVHDAILAYTKPFYTSLETFLPPDGINFTVIANGETKEF